MLISVSIWPIWAAVSLEPSVMSRVTSEYFLARSRALTLMALSQPWSAWGLTKPMVTFLPGLSSAAAAWLSVEPAASFGSLLVQAVRKAPAAEGGGTEEQSSAAGDLWHGGGPFGMRLVGGARLGGRAVR